MDTRCREEFERRCRRNRRRIALVGVVAVSMIVVGVTIFAAAVAFPASADDDGNRVTPMIVIYVFWAILTLIFVVGFGIDVGRRVRRATERTLERAGVTTSAVANASRVQNVVDGLAIAMSIPVPRVAILDDPACNVFVAGSRARGTTVAVTRGAVETLGRPELEALLAVAVCQIAVRDVALGTLVIACHEQTTEVGRGGFVLPPSWFRSMRNWVLANRGSSIDSLAVSFTRNPEALVRAFNRLAETSTKPGTWSDDDAHLWVLDPDATLLPVRAAAVTGSGATSAA